MNNFACLSLGKDVFSIGYRYLKTVWGENKKMETPIVTVNEFSTVLWVDYDGDGLVFISNNNRYSHLDLVIKPFPAQLIIQLLNMIDFSFFNNRALSVVTKAPFPMFPNLYVLS